MGRKTINMIRYRIFKVTTVKETNTKPTRIKIEDLWRGGKIVIGYTAEGPSTRTERVVQFLNEKGITICADSYDQHSSICFLMTTDFKTPLLL